MKRLSLLIMLLSVWLVGCMQAPEITESEAIAIIEQLHTNSFGTTEVISIDYRFGRYAVEWENAGNCEWGIDHVDGDDGRAEMKQASIC